jgi:hypothetical protein
MGLAPPRSQHQSLGKRPWEPAPEGSGERFFAAPNLDASDEAQVESQRVEPP